MTRQIKFRAWNTRKPFIDEALNEMVEFELTDMDGNYICVSGTYLEGEYVLMQFTGLLDSNGKEIYEGDILSSEYESIGSKRDCHPVEWNESGGSWSVNHSINDCCKPWRGNLGDHHRSEEIIGNIYENPELLK